MTNSSTSRPSGYEPNESFHSLKTISVRNKQVIFVGKISKKSLEELTACGFIVVITDSPKEG